MSESAWKTGSYSCCPPGDCFRSWCCPCIFYGRTEERLKDPSLANHDDFNPICKRYAWIQCWGCGWYKSGKQRTEIRERYHIDGTERGDMCFSFWCQPCAVIQNDREVAERSRLLAAGPDKQGYRPQTEGMQMAPQTEQAPVAAGGAAQGGAAGVNGVNGVNGVHGVDEAPKQPRF